LFSLVMVPLTLVSFCNPFRIPCSYQRSPETWTASQWQSEFSREERQ
jgi:hypothetical protein